VEIRRGFDLAVSVDDVEQLSARRLAELVVNQGYRGAGMLQALRVALASTQSDDFLAQILVDEIQAARSNHRFYDDREGHTLADTIERIRESIAADLTSRSQTRAAHLLGQLIRLDGHAFEQSDDSDDVIREVIRQAVSDYGQAWAALQERNIDELSAEVLALFSNEADGVHEGIIVAFRHVLGTAGLDVLENLSRSRSAAAGTKDRDRMARALQQIATARALLAASKSAPEAIAADPGISGESPTSVNPAAGAKET